MLLRSYRSRLVYYCLLLLVFLTGTLIYSYRYVDIVIRKEADSHMDRMVQLLNAHMALERDELQRYAAIVSDDLRLKEYMFVVAEIGGETEPLATLYDRVFGWLPIDRRVIVANDGRIFVGEEYTDLTAEIIKRKDTFVNGIFYFKGAASLEVVAMAPIFYRDRRLGFVAVSSFLNTQWLDRLKRITGGHFFLEQNYSILASTLSISPGESLIPHMGKVLAKNDFYKISQISLPGDIQNLPNLWFGFTEATLVERLAQHRHFTFILITTGIIAILFMGLMIIRNFNKPLLQLSNITREVAAGHLPNLRKSKAQNEIDELSNHFADMLEALRDKQAEIDRTHAELEKTAITDSLTGLYNRRYLQEVYPKLLAQAHREANCIFALLFDIDYFKKVNDNFGHLSGDQCLIQFAKTLKQGSRANDYLFRMGGEEFLILSVGEKLIDTATFADKLRNAIETSPVQSNGNTITLTASCGVCCARPVTGELANVSLTQMLSHADLALYQAKSEGRNRICIYNNNSDACITTCGHQPVLENKSVCLVQPSRSGGASS